MTTLDVAGIPPELDHAEKYALKRHIYEGLSRDTARIIELSFDAASIRYHTIENRAKSVDSFQRKANKLDESGTAKYRDPISQIKDLSGVRVITYTLKDVEQVSDFIQGNFEVVERTDVGEERFRVGKFCYQSIHFLVNHVAARISLPDFSIYQGMTCEIQVRTVLQHAWAEIEHDIQYKSQSDLPSTLRRKFIALAGLIEIADREFQAIQDQDSTIKTSVVDSLQVETTKIVLEDSSKSPSGRKGGGELIAKQTVRDFVQAKKYGDALRLYGEMIAESPGMHTLYLGRAKVLYLVGNRSGAEADLDRALQLNANDPDIGRLREQIIEGNVLPSRPVNEEANRLTREGNEAIAKGDGITAFELYSQAQDAGASRPFSVMNKGMACYLADDFSGARIQLASLEIREGTTLAVSLVSLYCLMSAAMEDQEGFQENLDRVRDLIEKCENFAYSASPLAKLERGLRVRPVATERSAIEMTSELFDLVRSSQTE